ncbi:MAG: hypothetical protein K2L69_08000 [Muribaculaceae bacterium]|nr:hypothetical protein [Muribaculaceae bacterium]MDE6164272.1 hypothetical protein [Muribaculaceae bacterium]MDE6344665.1 hypothetical protein [Muribaculaceae bacterium]MDE6610527.1 hypothetical protein [Muribaculaceae bacterium]
MKTLLFTIILLLFALLMLGVKVLFVKDGKFPSHHRGHHATERRNQHNIT